MEQEAPQIIVVDIGNSAIKLAIASRDSQGQHALESKLHWLHADFSAAELDRWAPRDEAHWFIASVHRGKTEALLQWIAKFRAEQPFSELAYTDLPLRIEVDAPQRVGIDRLLTAVRRQLPPTAGPLRHHHHRRHRSPINAIDQTGQFLGGAILPGKPLLAKVLHDYTDALPLISDFNLETNPATQPIGKNTTDAIRSGIHFGLQGAVRQIIEHYQKELGGEVEIFIAGGDAETIHQSLQLGTLAPDLVLEGAAIVAHSLLTDE